MYGYVMVRWTPPLRHSRKDVPPLKLRPKGSCLNCSAPFHSGNNVKQQFGFNDPLSGRTKCQEPRIAVRELPASKLLIHHGAPGHSWLNPSTATVFHLSNEPELQNPSPKISSFSRRAQSKEEQPALWVASWGVNEWLELAEGRG